MTRDGAMNLDERRELIGGEPQVQRPLESQLRLVGDLLNTTSLRSHGLR